MNQTAIPRPEYPRPQFVRAAWINLNGTWSYRTDRPESGEARGFQHDAPFTETITVPFCRESRLSGIGDTDFCDSVWYRHPAGGLATPGAAYPPAYRRVRL